MNKILKRNIKKHLKILPTVAQLIRDARKGEAKKGWYSRATRLLKYCYGERWEAFVRILAATSPRQTVELNLQMSMNIFSKWEASEFATDAKTIKDLAYVSDLKARRLNVGRSIRGESLSGLKVTAFCSNLLGDLDQVTIDTWMLTYSGIVHSNQPTKSFNLAYAHRIKQAAKVLRWKPAEVQECIWCYAYSVVNKCSVIDVAEFDIPMVIV